jgi:hypothetical protein
VADTVEAAAMKRLLILACAAVGLNPGSAAGAANELSYWLELVCVHTSNGNFSHCKDKHRQLTTGERFHRKRAADHVDDDVLSVQSRHRIAKTI